MKKIISIIIAVALFACIFSSCTATDEVDTKENDNLSIVTTVFPEYDWVKNILGDNPAGAEVTLLLDSGVDLHSYQPTAEDILKITNCDLFIYVGGESDEWVEPLLEDADFNAVNLLEAMGDKAKEEEIVEGMQAEEEEDGKEGEEEAEYDEHVWLSLRNAAFLTDKIAGAVESIDPGNAETYRSNTEEYIAELNALDKEYEKAADGASVKTLLFGDRFPFRYLTDDYGLSYYAAFVGCSAETEASFETVSFLAEKTDELALKYVMTIEGSDHSIAETIIASTGTKDQEILTMDSMQSTTAEDIKNGANYISIMRDNLSVLKKAIG